MMAWITKQAAAEGGQRDGFLVCRAGRLLLCRWIGDAQEPPASRPVLAPLRHAAAELWAAPIRDAAPVCVPGQGAFFPRTAQAALQLLCAREQRA